MPDEKSLPIKYSLVIDIPSSDIDTNGRWQFHCTIASESIDRFKHISNHVIPDAVIDFFKAMEKQGCFRVEVIAGATSYKLYIQPPAE